MLAAAALLLGGCSQLKLSDEGQKVRVLDPNEVGSCRLLGKTNASTTARMVFERPEKEIAKELRIVASNSAARMGGDTIVPLTIVEEGQQTFQVYKCVNPDG